MVENNTKNNGWGGKRTGAGRKPGQKTQLSVQEEQLEQFIVDEYKSGIDSNEIALLLNIPISKISRILRKHNICRAIRDIKKYNEHNYDPGIILKKGKLSKPIMENKYYKIYHNGKVYLHSNIIWDFNNPNDRLGKFDVVHHIDGNKQNDNIDNLQKLTISEHSTLHNNIRHNNI